MRETWHVCSPIGFGTAEQGLCNCRASVRLSVCSIRLQHAAAAGLLQPGDIDWLLHGRRSAAAAPQHGAAANAGSATLSAKGRG